MVLRVVLALCMALSALAQSERGNISGIVSDPQGARGCRRFSEDRQPWDQCARSARLRVPPANTMRRILAPALIASR